jgi:hypothetical protein
MTEGESFQQPVVGPSLPEPEAEPTLPHEMPAPRRSVFGPTVWICGALIWSYVVLGQLVIEANFPEALAWLIVAGVFAGVWSRAQRGGSLWRTWAPGMLAALLFLFEVGLTSSFLGTSRRSVAAAVGLALCLFGIAQFFVGRSLTAAPALELHRNQRIALIVTWVIVAGSSGIVLLSMLS